MCCSIESLEQPSQIAQLLTDMSHPEFISVYEHDGFAKRRLYRI
jgi:hypothetical protein